MKNPSCFHVVAAILAILIISDCFAFAQNEEIKTPIKINWSPLFDKGIIAIQVTNIGNAPIKILPHLSYYCVMNGHIPKPTSGDQSTDVYSPTVIFVAKNGISNLPARDSGGIEPGLSVINPGQMKEIKLSCSDIIEIAKECQEADFFLMVGDKALNRIVLTQVDDLWKKK